MKNIAFGFVLFLIAVSVQAKEWTTVRIAVDVPYEPFQYKAPDGTITGFETELGNAVCAEIGVKCEWIVQGWDGLIPGLLARKFDVIMSSMSITPERAKKVMFTKGYYNTPTGWFAKKGAEIDLAGDLKDLRIGAQRGTIQDIHATDNYKAAKVVRYNTADELALDLYGGRLDIVIVDYPVGETTILKGTKGEDYVQVGDFLQLGDGVGAAFRPRDKKLVEKFNQALETVKTNGTFDEIRKKYFDYDIKI